MWDIIITLVLMYPVVEMAEEWRQDRVAKRLLTEMRGHVAQNHHWDITRGQWLA